MPDAEPDDFIEIELRPPRLVAERALILANVTRRGLLDLVEDDLEQAESDRFELFAWSMMHFAGALELEEEALLREPAGGLAEDEIAACLDAGESLAMLVWCLSPTQAPLPEPDEPAPISDLLHALPGPWDDPAPYLSGPSLRSEEQIAVARERAEVWLWRSSIENASQQGRATAQAIAEVACEAATSGLIDRADDDLAIAGVPFAQLGEDRQATIVAVSTARLHALNWVCGFGGSWEETPLDID